MPFAIGLCCLDLSCSEYSQGDSLGAGLRMPSQSNAIVNLQGIEVPRSVSRRGSRSCGELQTNTCCHKEIVVIVGRCVVGSRPM